MTEKTITLVQALAMAEAALNQGNVGQAQKIYQSILSQIPNHKEAQIGLKKIAVASESSGAENKRNQLQSEIQIVIQLFQKGEGLNALKQGEVLQGKYPTVAFISNLLGTIHSNLGNQEASLLQYERAVQIDPEFAEGHYNLGVSLNSLGQYDEAVVHFQRATEIKPDYAKAYNSYANSKVSLGELEEAVTLYKKALQLNPKLAEAHTNLGNVYAKLGKNEEAVVSHEQALLLSPNDANVHYNLGRVYKGLCNFEKAIENIEKALVCDPSLTDAQIDLGVLHGAYDQPELALRYFEGLAGEGCKTLGFFSNYANILNDLGRHKEAISYLEKALNLAPGSADIKYNLGFTYLLMANFKEGWKLYEHRLETKVTENCSKHSSTLWRGEVLDGKSILVLAEQGLGDQIQFVRYVRYLKEMGAHTIVECHSKLAALFGRCEFIDSVVGLGEVAFLADYHCSLLSLPERFSEAFLKPHLTPYLAAGHDNVSFWKNKLSAMLDVKVGICWQGNPDYEKDGRRSMPLQHFKNLAHVSGVSLISLQKGEKGEAQIPSFRNNCELFVMDELVGRHTNLDDAAAVVSNLDLVITSCTSVAHLAASLNIPTWIILGKMADWRWFVNTQTSPWYPSVTLFRQNHLCDWDEVFSRVEEELRSFVDSRVNLIEGRHD